MADLLYRPQLATFLPARHSPFGPVCDPRDAATLHKHVALVHELRTRHEVDLWPEAETGFPVVVIKLAAFQLRVPKAVQLLRSAAWLLHTGPFLWSKAMAVLTT